MSERTFRHSTKKRSRNGPERYIVETILISGPPSSLSTIFSELPNECSPRISCQSMKFIYFNFIKRDPRRWEPASQEYFLRYCLSLQKLNIIAHCRPVSMDSVLIDLESTRFYSMTRS